jgi:hypothetical protein
MVADAISATLSALILFSHAGVLLPIVDVTEAIKSALCFEIAAPLMPTKFLEFCFYSLNHLISPSHISWELPRFVAKFQKLGRHERP